jgi:hypothetical protein
VSYWFFYFSFFLFIFFFFLHNFFCEVVESPQRKPVGLRRRHGAWAHNRDRTMDASKVVGRKFRRLVKNATNSAKLFIQKHRPVSESKKKKKKKLVVPLRSGLVPACFFVLKQHAARKKEGRRKETKRMD